MVVSKLHKIQRAKNYLLGTILVILVVFFFSLTIHKFMKVKEKRDAGVHLNSAR